MENKVVKVVKVNGAVVTVEECTSKKGNSYRAIFIHVNGAKIQVGFVNAFTELDLLKAGVKI